MKKIIFSIYTLISSLLFCSCADYLDKDPQTDTSMSYEAMFKNPHYAMGFLNNIYLNLREGFDPFGDGSMMAAACDEAVCSNSASVVHFFNNGGINTTYNPDDVWSHYYRGIRKCNIFLREIDGLIALHNSIPENDRDRCRGEAIFLRAYFHFELMKRYQNIFWVDKVLDPFNEDEIFKLAQLDFRSMSDLIAQECDKAYELLPKKRYSDDSALKGRPLASAPKALKSRVLLYAASPLNNPENDPEQWLKAELAAKEYLSEFQKVHPKQPYGGFYNKMFNAEIIFATAAKARNDIERNNFPVSYQGRGLINPTQDLVDCYSMRQSNNLDPLKGSPSSNIYNEAAPYVAKRDLRYDAVIYDGMEFKTNSFVECFVGGKDGLGFSNTSTKTGYYLNRYVVKSIDLSRNETAQRQWILFRTSEIMLNYAEALNERVGAAAEVTKALAEFRSLSGLKPFTGLSGYDKDSMREYIKNERRIELAFEDHRFWDLRRWKDAERVLNQPVHGMRVIRDLSGTDDADAPLYEKRYERFEVEKRSFDPKFYWYPIPRSEMLKYKNAGVEIKQNPGW